MNAEPISGAYSAAGIKNSSNDRLVPAIVAAAEFGITRRTLARWVDSEHLEFPAPVIINLRWFFSRAALEAWKASRLRNVARTDSWPSCQASANDGQSILAE